MITEEKINDIVTKIAETVHPEKIVLFGSYASGTPNENSDLDVCVVVKNAQSLTPGQVRKILWGAYVPIDIVVYSEDEINKWCRVKSAFPTTIMQKGKVVYERR